MQRFRKQRVKSLLNFTVKSLYVLVVGVSLLLPAQPASVSVAHAQAQTCTVVIPGELAPTTFTNGTPGPGGSCVVNGTTYSPNDFGTFGPPQITNSDTPKQLNQQTPASQGANDTGCGLGSVDLCIADVVYVFTAGIMSVFAYIGGVVFSIAVSLSLNSIAYSLNFLSSGWAAVRDIANMAFIFMLIYLAFTIMLQAETHGTNKTLATIIIMALLINFSFFITRVVIDGGNILAVQFYNSIPGPSLEQSASSLGTLSGANLASKLSPAKTKDLTASIMNMLKVTDLFSTPSFTEWRKADHGFLTTIITLCLLYIILGIIFGILASTFLFVGFKFLYRIVALWFVIILAPLAFIARGLSTSGSKTFYKLWQNMLIEFTFYPAIFLFTFLLVSYFVTQMSNGVDIGQELFTNFNTISNTQDQSFFLMMGRIVGSLVLRLGIVVILLYFGLKVADMVVERGNKGAEAVTGWAGRRLGGMTYGVAGYAGRNSIGAIGRKYAPAIQEKASSQTSVTSKALWGTLNKANKKVAFGSYDARGIPRVQSTLLQSSRLDVGTPTKLGDRRGLLVSNVTDKSLAKLDKDTKKQIAAAANAQKASSTGAKSTVASSAKISSIVAATRPTQPAPILPPIPTTTRPTQPTPVLPPIPTTTRPGAASRPNPTPSTTGTPAPANTNVAPGTLTANPTDRAATSFSNYAAIPVPASGVGSGVAPQTAQSIGSAGYTQPSQPANSNTQGGRVDPTVSNKPGPVPSVDQYGRTEPTLGAIPVPQKTAQTSSTATPSKTPPTPPATPNPDTKNTSTFTLNSAQDNTSTPSSATITVPQPSPERANQLSAEVTQQQTENAEVAVASARSTTHAPVTPETVDTAPAGANIGAGGTSAATKTIPALEEPARITPSQQTYLTADPSAKLAAPLSGTKPTEQTGGPTAFQKAKDQVRHEEELSRQKEKDIAYFETLKKMRESVKKAGRDMTSMVRKNNPNSEESSKIEPSNTKPTEPEHNEGGESSAEEKV